MAILSTVDFMGKKLNDLKNEFILQILSSVRTLMDEPENKKKNFISFDKSVTLDFVMDGTSTECIGIAVERIKKGKDVNCTLIVERHINGVVDAEYDDDLYSQGTTAIYELFIALNGECELSIEKR